MDQMLHGNAALLHRMEHMEAQFAAMNAKFDAGPGTERERDLLGNNPDLISRHAWSFWR